MANKIQIKRGLKASLPTLNIGEPALCTDTKEVYVGSASGNIKLASDEKLVQRVGKTGDTMSGALTFENGIRILGKKSNNENANIARVSIDDITDLGEPTIPTTLYGTLLSYNHPTLGVAEIAIKSKPSETIITSGFASGWSGEIRLRKNQEGLVSVTATLTKNAAILAGGEVVFTLPSGFRPSNPLINFINLFSVANIAISNSFTNTLIDTAGGIGIFPVSGANLTDARRLYQFNVSFYV